MKYELVRIEYAANDFRLGVYAAEGTAWVAYCFCSGTGVYEVAPKHYWCPHSTDELLGVFASEEEADAACTAYVESL